MTTMSTTPVRTENPARGWAITAHLLGLILGLVGPLFALFVGCRRNEFARQHARQAINFQATMGLVLLAIALVGSLSDFSAGLLGLAFLVADVVFPIRAAVRVGRGEWQPYPPIAIPFLRDLPEPVLR